MNINCSACNRRYRLGSDALVVPFFAVAGDFMNAPKTGVEDTGPDSPDLIAPVNQKWESLDVKTRNEQHSTLKRLNALIATGMPRWWKCQSCGHVQKYTLEVSISEASRGGRGILDARQVAAREAIRKRNRVIIIGVLVIGIGFLLYLQDRNRKGVIIQDKLAYVEKWIDLEKRETGGYWNCVMAIEVDIGLFQKGEQFQQRIEAAYFTQQKTFADYLITDCVPKMERARQAFSGGLRDAPSELTEVFAKYSETLPKLQAGMEAYAENIKKRSTTKDTDQIIQELGSNWHMTQDITAETAAYEKFLYCAIPGLAKMKDAQEVLEYMSNECFKKDPVAFMERVRTTCGPHLVVADKEAKVAAKSVPTWKQSHKKFLEEEMRQMQAWESCSKRSRKGRKVDDLEPFLLAAGDYINARGAVVKAGRDLQEAGK